MNSTHFIYAFNNYHYNASVFHHYTDLCVNVDFRDFESRSVVPLVSPTLSLYIKMIHAYKLMKIFDSKNIFLNFVYFFKDIQFYHSTAKSNKRNPFNIIKDVKDRGCGTK